MKGGNELDSFISASIIKYWLKFKFIFFVAELKERESAQMKCSLTLV